MKLLVPYASLSGNSEFIARQLHDHAHRQPGVTGPLPAHADTITLAALKDCDLAVFVIPTWGAGEVPADAELLWKAIAESAANGLAGLRFAVVALGDRRYPAFCAAGLATAKLLAAHGATQLADPLLLDGGPAEKFIGEVGQWADRLLAGGGTGQAA